MTPHDLLAAFETLAEAPDGIARLRELVLQLAVRGKLVPQDPNDEPACVLLERIAMEKARLVKEGKIPKAKPLLPIDEDEVPSEVPEGWSLIPFGEVFLDIFTGPFGTALKASEYIRGTTPVINPQNMKDGAIVPTDDTCVGPETMCRLSTFTVYEWDVIVARRGEMGRCAVISPRESGWLCGTGSLVLRPPQEIVPQYVTLFLRSPATVTRLTGDSVGSTMSNLNQRIMVNLPFGLPPLPEQHRIVAKVDTLMGLLDHLEAARSERETTRVALRNAALVTLRDAPDAEAVEVAWTRIAERMDDLFTDPADVASLRQTILQLAVRGKLVPQDPNDEPACLLLERIAAEKARLVKEGRLPKPKLLPQVAEDDMPFEVPSRWMYARLNNLLIEDSRNGLSAQPNQGPPGIEILRISAGTARNDAVVMEEDHRFLELEEEAILTYELQRGDLLACRFNGNLHYVGRVAVYEKYSGHRQVYPDKLIRLRVHQSLINPWYIRLAMNCQGIRSVIERTCATTAGNIGISATNLKTVAIPIPPLQEQHRIVTKVNALMALCDALEARFAASRAAQAAFAAAAVHHLDA